jgi:hypothetical protein
MGDLQACREGMLQSTRRNDLEYLRYFGYEYLKRHPNGARWYEKLPNDFDYKINSLFSLRETSPSKFPSVNRRWTYASEGYLKIGGVEIPVIWTEESLVAVYQYMEDMLIATGNLDMLETCKCPYKFLLEDTGTNFALTYLRNSDKKYGLMIPLLNMINAYVYIQNVRHQFWIEASKEYDAKLIDFLLLPHVLSEKEQGFLDFLRS